MTAFMAMSEGLISLRSLVQTQLAPLTEATCMVVVVIAPRQSGIVKVRIVGQGRLGW